MTQSSQPTTTRRGPAVELSERERESYSLRRAVCIAAGIDEPASFEADVSQEIARHLPAGYLQHGGVFVPTFVSRAGLDAHTSLKGDELVFTEPGSFITALRRKALVLQLGARFLPGLKGDVDFPRQDTAGVAAWMADNPGADVGQSDVTLSQVPLRPKILMSTTAFSRVLLQVSTPQVDQLVAEDMAESNARAVDLAAIHGTGTGNQPTGLYSASGVASVSFAAGPPTFDHVVEMETAVATADAETDTLTAGYLTTPEVRDRAKRTPEMAGSSSRLWGGGRMNDRRAEATNQVSKTLGAGGDEHGIVYGIWSELVVGEWGAIEIVYDPYTQKKRGMVEVTGFYLADVAIRHEESFRKGTGLLP